MPKKKKKKKTTEKICAVPIQKIYSAQDSYTPRPSHPQVYICYSRGVIAERFTDKSENARDAILVMLTWKRILNEVVQPLTRESSSYSLYDEGTWGTNYIDLLT